MNRVLWKRTVPLLFLIVAGCAANGDEVGIAIDCNKTLCGCPRKTTETVTVKLTDADENPIADAQLICHDDITYLGTTNPNGLLKLQVSGDSSPGCGFIPDCQIAYFREDGIWGRPFWFIRFIRGERVVAGDSNIELIDESRQTSE